MRGQLHEAGQPTFEYDAQPSRWRSELEAIAPKRCKARPARTPPLPPPEPAQIEDIDLTLPPWDEASSCVASPGTKDAGDSTPTPLASESEDEDVMPMVHQRPSNRRSVRPPTICLEGGLPVPRSEKRRDTVLSDAGSVGPGGEEVFIHMYDLGKISGHLNEYVLKGVNLAAYHCGVEVFGVEYSFQGFCDAWHNPEVSGIVSCQPRSNPAYSYRQTISMGRTMLSQVAIDSVLLDLRPEWPASSYHLVSHNCINFAEELIRRLQVPEPFPTWVRGAVDAATGVPAAYAIADAGWSMFKWWSSVRPTDAGSEDGAARKGNKSGRTA